MLHTINPTTTAAWKALGAHATELKEDHLRDLFAKDPQRFTRYSLQHEGIHFDYSKNLVTDKTLELLQGLAAECKVKDGIEAMFSGEKINQTEDRSVLHTALRNFSGKPVYSDGKDVMPDVQRVQAQMKAFSGRIHSGEWK